MKRSLSFLVVLVGIMSLASYGWAQDDPPFECDDNFGECGTPEMSGGGCGCGGGGSILVANTDLGDTYQFADDYDDDGHEDEYDNCPAVENQEQADSDGDGVGDACDNCLDAVNADQSDIDGDGFGDACDDDQDGDTFADSEDNCPSIPNKGQGNQDDDEYGDACDPDIDNDGKVNTEDMCPFDASIDTPTEDQKDLCNPDGDGDGVGDATDNCIDAYNPEQGDIDDDGEGDACDQDIDGDAVFNHLDNCSVVVNEGQLDSDRDGLGDDCDPSFCFVVYGDEGNCLDPADAELKVYSPPTAGMQTGEALALRLFANRENQAMRYEWTVIDAPGGSSATVENSKGTVTISTPFEYRYLKGQVPTFMPDQPGSYQLKVTATAIWEDRVSGVVETTATYTTTLEVGGEPIAGDDDGAGCQAVSPKQSVGVFGGAALVLFGLVAVAMRRRRS